MIPPSAPAMRWVNIASAITQTKCPRTIFVITLASIEMAGKEPANVVSSAMARQAGADKGVDELRPNPYRGDAHATG
jgi:hypothetical protein